FLSCSVLANAGLALGAGWWGRLGEPVALGVMLGLVAGKTAGIFGFVWLSVKLGLATKPAGATWGQFAGVALLAGIGFTMSIFVAGLAFPDRHLLETAKAGILTGSLIAALGG